ncbi:bifunctional diguanylate cyclase/phosphodiesterase [Acidocella sp. MX-AZ02]|uniref:putative bifunctional diguanylate cyclase/phosphodiesterase n=1 Tax=Acidocella sp. MX-AZ02 TaxID=1214225 RepID=UPI000A03C768|nr:EAL domain-containing protein [Acidocella sp. MX-AZ02]
MSRFFSRGRETMRKLLWASRFMHWLRDLMALPEDDPALAATQLAALSQYVPAFYLVLIFNLTSLAITHMRVAPPLLGRAIPLLLLITATIRLALWLHRRRHLTPREDAVRKLRAARRSGVVLGSCAGGWALLLLPYGDVYQRLQVEITVALTLLTCFICLISLRSAAILLGLIVGVPYALVFLSAPQTPVRLSGAGTVLVLFVTLQMLLRNAADFVALSHSERELQRRQRETQLLSDENSRLAYLDSLTGLPNRRRFFAELEQALSDAAQGGRCLAVALMDLDRFKGINDMHGHAAGDRLLSQVGARLRRLVGEGIFIARLGGDEFGVILRDCQGGAAVRQFAADVRHVLEAPCIVGDRLATISSSLGVAIYPDAGGTAEELFERADYALYHGKQTEKGGMVLFSREHETRIRAEARLEQAFRHSDMESELWVAFQPIVDVAQRKVVAFEALARWQSPELGLVSPGLFVPLAERSQLVCPMTAVLLQKALAAAREWPEHVSLNFNLSPYNFTSVETMSRLRTLVTGSGLAPSRIEFEVTESALLDDFEHAQSCLRELRALGARIALDDFGTGFSSLSHVSRLQLDKIKIDRSFVIDVHSSATSANIVKTIISLCDNLRLDCVVEGVETLEQLHTIAALGGHFIQGFLISRPVPAEAVAGLIAGFEAAAPHAA